MDEIRLPARRRARLLSTVRNWQGRLVEPSAARPAVAPDPCEALARQESFPCFNETAPLQIRFDRREKIQNRDSENRPPFRDVDETDRNARCRLSALQFPP